MECVQQEILDIDTWIRGSISSKFIVVYKFLILQISFAIILYRDIIISECAIIHENQYYEYDINFSKTNKCHQKHVMVERILGIIKEEIY